jgi:drug/metabolite transporter (DMT)-like permease
VGAVSLIPILLAFPESESTRLAVVGPMRSRSIIPIGMLLGVVLFAGSSLQQIGLVYTTAGNAGFITGLYVIIVPILGMIWKQKTDSGTWIGAILAAWGLYLLSVTADLTIQVGDLLVFIGAFFWAGHVLLVGHFSPRVHPILLAICQSTVCSLLSLLSALVLETITIEGLLRAALPIFYGGFFSVGIAYTLQIIAQQDAHPAHAAILMSLEAVFALAGGWFILGEAVSYRGLLGCGLMLAGMLLAQLWNMRKMPRSENPLGD